MTILVAFGTRPEAIKLAPVIAALRRRPGLRVRVVTTAQHRQLLDQALRVFDILPDVDLALMEPEQTLAQLSAAVLTALDALIVAERPDLLVVQGDTTSALMCALAAFYRHVPVGHVEAGLRTPSVTNPFPEEMNRRLLSRVATLHFAATELGRRNLIDEGAPDDQIWVTGNPVVDALQQIRASAEYASAGAPLALADGERLVVVTLHRRESWGAPLAGMCQALRTIVERHPRVRVAIPVHLNPAVRQTIHDQLSGVARVTLLDPLDYFQFLRLLELSTLVLTDSGGVQEEAPVLGRPVMILRDTTERPEAIEAGVSRLVGTAPGAIVAAASELLENADAYGRMARTVSPFGDGRAAERIADIIAARQDVVAAGVAAAVS